MEKENISFIKRYYYIIFGLIFLLIAMITLFIETLPIEYTAYITILALTCFTVRKDILQDTKTNNFLKVGLPYLFIIILVMFTGNDFWHKILRLELKIPIIFNLNPIFDGIYLNSAEFARIYQPEWLNIYMRAVYNTGFVLSVMIPLFRSALLKDFKKMLKYTLSAHVIQVFLITPMYFLFRLNEVWYVHGTPDPLMRNLNTQQAIETTLNCFPSMHTSIAFAMFLLVLREKDKFFKYIWGFYCLSIIFSTMYLEIHWVIDVIFGLLLGYVTVKLVDFIIAKLSKKFKI